jgi:hypothetical protein
MLSGSCSVGTVARSENKSNGMRKAQSSPGATGRIATRITAARKDQTINLRKEYILRIDHTPASVQNLNDVADDFGYQMGLALPGLVADKFARNLCFSLREATDFDCHRVEATSSGRKFTRWSPAPLTAHCCAKNASGILACEAAPDPRVRHRNCGPESWK